MANRPYKIQTARGWHYTPTFDEAKLYAYDFVNEMVVHGYHRELCWAVIFRIGKSDVILSIITADDKHFHTYFGAGAYVDNCRKNHKLPNFI